MDKREEHIQSLIFEKLAGVISEQDNVFLDELLRTDPQVQQMWTDIVQTTAPAKLREISTEERWKQLRGRLKNNKRNTAIVYLKWMSAAAAILIAGWFVFHNSPGKPKGPAAVAGVDVPKNKVQLTLADGSVISLDSANSYYQASNLSLNTEGNKVSLDPSDSSLVRWATLKVPVGKDYKVVLDDGTEVWLNAVSSLKFPYRFSGNIREVYLEGEAYFSVTKNPDRPFIVHNGQTAVRVLGTRFNVEAYVPEKITTALVEGAVLMEYGGSSVKLSPGYKVSLQQGQLVKSTFDANEMLAWMHGVAYFRESRLEDIAALLSRFYEVQIVFDNPSLKNERFSGAVNKSEPLAVFLKNIEIASGVQAREINGQLHLR
ncbi:FecR domain-containing protein [Niabella sp. CC-SYL272]|uniref:FecR family protein n=1 Tax=Niabella agricola TaxID=2891571 RepID=UPI001F459520|nr:FecR domain-containing protein [Niabella agricola]MCF3111260.1 FecR domain-containing protein [Niabella agricola]